MNNTRLGTFVAAIEKAVTSGASEPAVIQSAVLAMAELVAQDDWLPAGYDQPHPQYYRQYPLHVDPQGRFSVVSFVWGPGQRTPIHNHLTWGVIGMLRGAEKNQAYRQTDTGLVADGEEQTLTPGSVASFTPRAGDVHRVSNALDDRVSISIHVYGTDIGQQKRHVFDPETGAAKEFVSGYSEPAASA